MGGAAFDLAFWSLRWSGYPCMPIRRLMFVGRRLVMICDSSATYLFACVYRYGNLWRNEHLVNTMNEDAHGTIIMEMETKK